jgi:hypothetical protein
VVYVLNPEGPSPAKVTVTFFSGWDGSVVEKVEQDVRPRITKAFMSIMTAGTMWVRIDADKPVLPWGFTDVSKMMGYDFDGIHMTFYQHEAPPQRKSKSLKKK